MEFTKKDSNCIQGIAILMMIFLHLFGFPERVPSNYISLFDGLPFGRNSLVNIATFCHVCVSMYVFVSGYGLQESSKQKKWNLFLILDKMFTRIFTFWCKYAIQFVVLVPMGILLGKQNLSAWQFFKAMFCLGGGTTINGEWWYVGFYLKLLIVFPIVSCVISRVKMYRNRWTQIFIFLIICLLCRIGLGSYGPLFIVSIYCSEYNFISLLAEKIKNKFEYMALILLVGGILLRFALMKKVGYTIFYADVLFLPLMIAAFLSVRKEKIFYRVLSYIGKHSLYMWLTHTFIIYYYFQEQLFKLRYAALIYLLTVLCSFFVSIILDKFFCCGMVQRAIKSIFTLERFILTKLERVRTSI